jgi:PAS domain S-box-containing protein
MATILIVDDLAANRKFLLTLLSSQGHRLIEAADGREALASARAEHPDLVITDVLMPVMDGYELVRQLRLDPTTSKILVVLYTAYYGEREARVVAMSNGVDDVLTKPAESAEVLKIVGRVLAGDLEMKQQPPSASALALEFDRGHLRLLTDTMPEQREDLRAANARLRALINIGLELSSETDTDRLFQRVCAAACDLFGATYVTLGIVDPSHHTLERVLTYGADAAGAADAPTWIMMGETVSGIFRTVVTERRTVRGDNPVGDPAGLQFPVRHPDVQAFLAAPVASPAEVYGWLCLVGNEGRSFTEDDEPLVMALSAQVGRIYEKLRLSAFARRRADELEHEVLERKLAESTVRYERDRAQRYLDMAQVILLNLDTEGRVTLINRKGCDLLGWTEWDLLGRDFPDTCLPARTRVALRRKFHTATGGDHAVIETPVVTKSGEELLIEWRNTLLRDDGGHVIGTFSSGTDITERHRAVEALRTAEERMRFALQNANVGIWDMDYATGTLRWSEIVEAQYGLQPGTFGKTNAAFLERVHPDDRASALETIGNAAKSGADFSFNHRSQWRDGTVRWLSGAGRVQLGAHGEPVRGVGISLDVTERHTLEAQYLQSQKMEAVGRLAGGVAHDFNNLLTEILGNCELLLADLDPDDAHRADITEIQKAGARAAGLTRQLLAFSRKEVLEPTVLDLNGLVSGMREMLERLIGEDVKVVLGLRAGLARVKADHGLVEQILMNLAVNARDAMPRGGTLTIDTASIDLNGHGTKTTRVVAPGSYVALTVTDTGTGMTPQVQARLFEPFFTTKEPGQGTGLGLATVEGIVTRSGGAIDVLSEIGRGTSFTVYFPKLPDTLPASPDTAAVDTPLIVARPSAGTATVLVVDDAAALRELTRRLLQRLGYTVLIAANGEEALRVFEENGSIDVLLTDVVMPGASGPELTRQLIKQRPALKVIYMSGYTEEAIARHGGLEPGVAFLHKPFTSATLGGKIREVMDR